MAVQFADLSDICTTPSLIYEDVVNTPVISSSYLRFAPPAGCPGAGIYFPGGAYVRKNMVSNQATLIVRCAVYFTSLGGIASVGAPFITLWDNGTAQCSLAVYQNGSIAIWNGAYYSGNPIATTGPSMVTSAGWYGIEAEITVGSAGSANVWLNGVQQITATGINTQQSAHAYANQVSVGDVQNNIAGMRADDWRVWDNSGSTQNAPTGTDGRLIAKVASGAGAFAQFTPNGAAANWQCTDEVPPNGGTTYVSGATSGLVDAYAMPAAAFTAAPLMVVAVSYASKNDGGTRSLEIGVDSGGTQGYGPSTAVGSTYAYIQTCIALDPNTGAAWTAAAADAAQHCKQETA